MNPPDLFQRNNQIAIRFFSLIYQQRRSLTFVVPDDFTGLPGCDLLLTHRIRRFIIGLVHKDDDLIAGPRVRCALARQLEDIRMAMA